MRAGRAERRDRRAQEPEAEGDCFLSLVLAQFLFQVVVVVVVAVLLLLLVVLAVVVVVEMLR